MLPGFVDAHGHVMGGGLQALSANLLSPPDGEVRDIASLQQTLRDWIKNNQQAVEKIKLVVGFGYDNAQLAELSFAMPSHSFFLCSCIPLRFWRQRNRYEATIGNASSDHAASF